jgi:ketosteroid isomerase-like protein
MILITGCNTCQPEKPEGRNLENLKKALIAINSNELDDLKEYIDEEVVYIIHGKSNVSGTYIGIDRLVEILTRIKAKTNGTMTAQPEVILTGGYEIMAYYKVTGTRPDGRKYNNYQAYLYKFKNGKLIEGQTIPVDQYAFDLFFED